MYTENAEGKLRRKPNLLDRHADAQQGRRMDPKWTQDPIHIFSLLLGTLTHNAVEIYIGFRLKKRSQKSKESIWTGLQRRTYWRVASGRCILPCFCVSRCLAIVIAGGSSSTRRFVTTKRRRGKKACSVFLFLKNYPQASLNKQYNPKRQQQVSRKADCFSWECVLPEWQTATHIHTSPGSLLSPVGTQEAGGRRRWAGTAPRSTDRTVTPSALTRSLPHRWHAPPQAPLMRVVARF